MIKLLFRPTSPRVLASAGRPNNWLVFVLLAGALAGVGAVTTPAFANETTAQLIEIMRENGSITERQYQKLKAAENTEARKSAEGQTKSEQKDWTAGVKLKGDFRLRYEHADDDARVNAAGNRVNRDRFRLRYRLGIIATPWQKLKIGAGLASGGDDPRSTNQTLGDTFSSKGIRLDYAYAQYQVNEKIKIIAGKFEFKNYLWIPTNLIWDSDINPEGISAHFSVNAGLGNTFINGGAWVLEEFSSDSDPYMLYVQLGQTVSLGNAFGTLAGTYYAYKNAGRPGALKFSAGTNSDNQFDVLNLSAVLGTEILDGRGKVSLLGDYIVNTDTRTGQDTGFAFGTKMAIDKWSFKYIYVDLDANAVPDSFPNADRIGGATAIKGHLVGVKYALVKNVAVGLDYYSTQSKLSRTDEQVLQANFVVKFP